MQPIRVSRIVVGVNATLRDATCDQTIVLAMEPSQDPMEEERQWVREALLDPSAAGKLYDKYYSDIYRYLFHATFNRTVAEDLTSNVFLAAFRSLPRFRWRGVSFKAWLYRIATNEIRMHCRRTRLAERVRSQDPVEPGHVTSTARESAQAEEERQLLHRTLLQLHLKYRTVLILRYLEDQGIDEIAEVTGQKPGTVKSRIHRGLARLQELLRRQGVLR